MPAHLPELSPYAGQRAGDRAMRFFSSSDFMDNLSVGDVEMSGIEASELVEWATAVGLNVVPTSAQENALGSYLYG
jgi:hypothetical protein